LSGCAGSRIGSDQFIRLDENAVHAVADLELSIRLASVINCNTRHAGQIEYLRSLVKYKGWFPAAEKRG